MRNTTTPFRGWLPCVWVLALLLALCPLADAQPQTFAHPSIPFTTADLNQLRANSTQQPWLAGYQALQADARSKLTYTSAGPFATVSRVPNINNAQWRNDMVAIHNLTFMYVFTGNTAYAQKATDLLDDWATTNTTWGGGENQLDIGDMAPYFIPAADILRGTYPGWTAANTQHVKDYFRTVLLPAAAIDYTLRDNNKGALQLQIGLGIAAFLDDAALFQKALEVYRIDAGGGLRCSLPNGEVGDTGRDDHWWVQIQALGWSAEVAWKQGVDVFAEFNNRLLAIGELYNQYSIAPATLPAFTPFGGYAAYWLNWGIQPGVQHQSPFNNIIENAYARRKGLATPYTTQMRGLVGEGAWSFLYLKSADASTATAPAPLVFPARTAATRLSRVEIGSTGINGSASYATSTGKWTLQGAGNSPENNVSFVGQPVRGDAGLVVKVESSASATAEVGLMLRTTLDASASYVAVRLFGGGGVGVLSKGSYANSTYRHTPPTAPWWLKLERVGNRVFAYHSPDGVSWSNHSLVLFAGLPADTYLGLYTISNNLAQLNTAVLSSVALTNTTPAAAPTITSSLAASGMLSTAFSYATTATNTPTSYSATGLPAGLGLNPSTGAITGTPTATGTFAVRVAATNASGTGAALVVISVSSNVAPAAPVPTAAVSNSVNIRLSWAAVSGASSYTVKRSLSATGPFATLQAGITGLYFIDTSPTPEVPNYYVVTALAGTLESGASRVVSASVPPPVPPRPVVSNQPAQVGLSWPASAGAKSYNVKRSPVPGGPYTLIGSPTATSYADASAPAGTGYYYVVSAKGNTLESADSPEAFGMAGATARTWRPTTADTLFGRATSWVENAVPQSPAVLTFGAANDTLLTNNLTGLAVARLEFAANAVPFTLVGNALTLRNDLVSRAATTQTLGMPLVLSGAINLNLAGPVVLTGRVSGTGSLLKDGDGLLDIGGLNTYSGNTTLGGGGVQTAGAGTGTPSAPTAGPLGTGRIVFNGGTLYGGRTPAVYYNDLEVPAGTGGGIYIGYTGGSLTLNGKLLGSGTLTTDCNVFDGINFNGDNTAFAGKFISKLRSGNYRLRFNTPLAGSARAFWLLDANGVDCHGIGFSTGTIEFGALSGRGYIRNNAGGSPTIRVGALNLSTNYGGTMKNFINLEKVGTGTFQMTGLHDFGGTTTIKAGKLMLDNDPVSGTFISPVVVEAGTFGGRGRTTAAVTVGTGAGAGATLDPGTTDTNISATPVGTFLTTSTLILRADATYAPDVNLSLGTSDKVTAGNVVLNNAILAPDIYATGTPAAGTSFTLIDHTGTGTVTGTFNNLPELAVVTLGGLTYRITYRGGTGNDVVLLDDRSRLPFISSAATATGTLSHAFSYTVTAVNSPTSYGATGLPAGLSLNPTTGVIAGTPTATGVFAVSLSATNANGTRTLTLTLTVESNVVAGLLAAGGDARATLDWNPVTIATSYSVKRAPAPGGPYTTVGTSPGPRYVDTSVSNGAAYYYVVAAQTASGEQPASLEDSAHPNLGQVAYYQFEEAGGPRGVDAWGGSHATLQATATRGPGYAGTALHLAGTDSAYATLPTGILNGAGDFTISTRVKLSALANGMRVFDFGFSTTQYMFLTVQSAVVGGKSLVRYGLRNGAAAEQSISYAYSFPLNTWVHLAVTKTGNTNTLYINGTAVATGSITTAGLTGTPRNYLGKSQFSDPLLQGDLDEFRIYSRALSATDLAVTGLLAAGGDARTVLDWDAQPAATSYVVQRATAPGGPYTQVGTSTTTRYTDTSVSNGTTYYYVVAAVDASGQQPPSAEAAASPNLGQVAYYQFDESAGTRGIDAWGGYHATLQATAMRSAGPTGTALALDGTATAYATLPTGVLNGTGDFTVSSWVKMDAISTWMRVFDFGNSTTQYLFLTVQAGLSAGKSIVRYGTKNGTAAEQSLSYAYSFPLNTWVHLALTKAGSTNTLYINGTAVATATITTPALSGTTRNYLGKSQFGDPLLQGALDEVRIYSRALSAAEVASAATPPSAARRAATPLASASHAAEASPALSLSPNPAQQTTALDLRALPATATYQVLLLDATGRTLRQLSLTGGQRHALDVAGLAPGLYHVRLTGPRPDGSALRQTLRLAKH